ncbi:MAG TPA: TetR family transcriptional regulator [Streptosporangiaceae bacterium]|nr:TetR family transcriptional regulator [Streptosporangiaceae bacterium]
MQDGNAAPAGEAAPTHAGQGTRTATTPPDKPPAHDTKTTRKATPTHADQGTRTATTPPDKPPANQAATPARPPAHDTKLTRPAPDTAALSAREATPARLSGRHAQAVRNDAAILRAARDVFLADPKAPIAAVAERAGVGISALYRRYPGKEELLRRLCHDGLRRFIAEAESAAAGPDPWRAFTGFLREVVVADVHSLTVHLAGTFTPTEEMRQDALRAGALATSLLERAAASGRMRPGMVPDDITLILEGCAAIRIPGQPERTSQLRLRYLTLLLDGLQFGTEPLPGPPPAPAELNWRWQHPSAAS